jgi:stage II sporulation protein AA (anti-sigma F factor antagonist)
MGISTVFTVVGTAGSDACVLRVEGDFDNAAVPRVRESLNAALSDGYRNIVLDLTSVTYMDSSALGFIVWADQRLQPVAGTLTLAGANADVSRVLELTGLIGVAPSVVVSASMADALTATALSPRRSAPLWVESFEFTADASRLASARERLGQIVAPLGLADSSVFDMKVAVGEALANAVRHGSPRGSSDMVCVEVRAYADRVDVVVSDTGCGYDGAVGLARDAFAPGGRGVLFMRALMDTVEFNSAVGGGTSVVLAKRRLASA